MIQIQHMAVIAKKEPPTPPVGDGVVWEDTDVVWEDTDVVWEDT